AAALYLAGLGREHIGMIAAPSNTAAGVDRRAGFLEGMAEAGLDINGRLVEGNWTEGSGRLAMDRLLTGDLPDAVFVSSDRMAVGALRAIHEAGLRCPQDIAIVSFDGLIAADQTMPRLTSMAQPVNDLGERAARLLDSIIGGDVKEPEQIVYPTELVVRESCGATIGSR
ncbi:MAG: substrate-binding domain-containing protein, partial [Acidimicrobiia bacterium]|nr:substrate-binding domain-containing protein [Acidimicrobiia bacterium]